MDSALSESKIVRITPDSLDAIQQISQLAKQVALPKDASHEDKENWAKMGFLVSGYDTEKYAELAKRKHFYAIYDDGRPVSFLLAYADDEEVDATDYGSKYIRETYGSDSVIIKQIATHPNHTGKGYARALYEQFANLVKADIYAAIVKEPPNYGSEDFHRSLSFEECDTYDHPDGKKRGIWRRRYNDK